VTLTTHAHADTALGDFGRSLATDAETAGRESVRMALAGRTPASGDIVFIFPSATYDLESLHRAAIAEAAPAEVVGCTASGAFTLDTQTQQGCVAAYIAADDLSFGVCHAELAGGDIAEATRHAAETARVRAGERYAHSVLVLLCDGLIPDQRAMARGSYEVTSAATPLVGGAAGDNLVWKATHTFGEGRVVADGLVAIWINSAQRPAVAFDHGWWPIGEPMLVTRAEGSVIHELDGRPALEAYLAQRGLPVKEDSRSVADRFMARPFGFPNIHGGYDLRHIHDIQDGRSLVLPAAVSEHTVVQVMATDPDSLLDGARRAALAAGQSLGRAPRLALVFSCCSRAPILGERRSEEVQLISDCLGGAPAGGFYSMGEFARVTGPTGIHHGIVAILAL
jgi:hypothetical protein